jgi:hypothetical protein
VLLDYRDFAPFFARPWKYSNQCSVRHHWPLLLFRGSSPREVGVGNHQVFIINISSKAIVGNAIPRVIPIARQLLTCSSDKIRNNYTTVLNQLANRHLIFKKLLLSDQDNDHAELHLRLNLVDLELEQFMKSAEQGCPKYKRNNIE